MWAGSGVRRVLLRIARGERGATRGASEPLSEAPDEVPRKNSYRFEPMAQLREWGSLGISER